LSSIEASEAEIVSDSDLRFAFVTQCSGRPDEIDTINCWARHQVEQSRLKWGPATHFVDALNKMREQLPVETSVADSRTVAWTTRLRGSGDPLRLVRWTDPC
jgi:hypothetical protein